MSTIVALLVAGAIGGLFLILGRRAIRSAVPGDGIHPDHLLSEARQLESWVVPDTTTVRRAPRLAVAPSGAVRVEWQIRVKGGWAGYRDWVKAQSAGRFDTADTSSPDLLVFSKTHASTPERFLLRIERGDDDVICIALEVSTARTNTG